MVFALALFGAAVTVVALNLEHFFATPPEQLVDIYRTHGCTCAFVWADSLRKAGFKVRMIEHGTSLKSVRDSLHTPANLRGCHVGAYFGYFLEGHVAPSAVHHLALQRPDALGLATESSTSATIPHVSIALEEQSTVMLIDRNGAARSWFEPNGSSR